MASPPMAWCLLSLETPVSHQVKSHTVSRFRSRLNHGSVSWRTEKDRRADAGSGSAPAVSVLANSYTHLGPCIAKVDLSHLQAATAKVSLCRVNAPADEPPVD